MESLENKDYCSSTGEFPESSRDKKMWPNSYRGLGIAYYEQENTKMRLLHLKMQFQPERRRQEQSVI